MAITRYQVEKEAPASSSQNVRDLYKGWLTEEIKADLVPRRQEFVTLLKNETRDFNKSTVIRSHNAFLGRAVFMVGKRRFDKRGTVGTHAFETIFHATSLEEVVEVLRGEGYTIFAVENVEAYQPVSLWDTSLPKKSAFLYGEEGRGLSSEEVALCDGVLFLELEGSVRSLNVASAATALMAEYTRQWRGSPS